MATFAFDPECTYAFIAQHALESVSVPVAGEVVNIATLDRAFCAAPPYLVPESGLAPGDADMVDDTEGAPAFGIGQLACCPSEVETVAGMDALQTHVGHVPAAEQRGLRSSIGLSADAAQLIALELTLNRPDWESLAPGPENQAARKNASNCFSHPSYSARGSSHLAQQIMMDANNVTAGIAGGESVVGWGPDSSVGQSAVSEAVGVRSSVVFADATASGLAWNASHAAWSDACQESVFGTIAQAPSSIPPLGVPERNQSTSQGAKFAAESIAWNACHAAPSAMGDESVGDAATWSSIELAPATCNTAPEIHIPVGIAMATRKAAVEDGAGSVVVTSICDEEPACMSDVMSDATCHTTSSALDGAQPEAFSSMAVNASLFDSREEPLPRAQCGNVIEEDCSWAS